MFGIQASIDISSLVNHHFSEYGTNPVYMPHRHTKTSGTTVFRPGIDGLDFSFTAAVIYRIHENLDSDIVLGFYFLIKNKALKTTPQLQFNHSRRPVLTTSNNNASSLANK